MERQFHMMLYRAFHAQRNYLRPSLAEIGLGSGQPKLLRYLSTHGPCSQRELAAYFEVDPAAVSRMLDALERNGFIVRTVHRNDRRSGMIQLTEQGEAACERWQDRCHAMEEKMLQGFTPDERALFSNYLSRAYRNLRDAQTEKEAHHEGV